MSEKPAHRRAKNKAAGSGGKTEVPIPGNQCLDALTKSGGRATEVERNGSPESLKKAVNRLGKSGARQKVLQVPQKNMDVAVNAMQEGGIGGTVKNMGGTKRRSVRPAKSPK